MPGNLAQSTATAPIKAILIGDSGCGKTGALWSLAKAGFELVIADFDNGLDVLRQLGKSDPKPLDNIYFESFQDEFMGSAMGPIVKGVPQAFTRFSNWMNHVKGEGYDLGPVTSWDTKRILVVDSNTHLGNAIMRYILTLKGRPNGPAQLQDWGEVQNKMEALYGMLYSSAVKCHVLVLCHVDYITNEQAATVRGLPMAPGKALSPKLPTYFNTMLIVKRTGAGKDAKRWIKTVSEGLIEAKLPMPGKLLDDLPIETGLATIFQTMKG